MIDTVAQACSAIVELDPNHTLRVGTEFRHEGEDIAVQAWYCRNDACHEVHVKVERSGIWDRAAAERSFLEAFTGLQGSDVAGSPD